MKRSIGRNVALSLWLVGSCGAVIFVCFCLFAIAYTRKINLGTLSWLAIGIFGAWQGFKMFNAERNSN